ncbi:MAG: SusC/RagA family TonB-linked outer membrane protein [Ferruginibacter sp.]
MDGKALENRPINNTLQGLQGVAPGLIVTRSSGQPGAEGWNINIRGISSLNGTNSPLLIVDGVEYADLNMLNPNDIASFSILKDAAAAAIYGAKAASGVILVTTKKGTAGKIRVNYTGQLEVQSTLSLPHKLHSWEIAEIQNIAAVNSGAAPTWSAPKVQLLKDSVNAFIPNDPNLQYFYGDYDYVAMAVKPTYTSSNQNINVSGGNDKTQYFIGLGYNNNNGMFRFGPDENKRYNGRMNLTTKFNNIFSLDSRLSFTQNKIANPAVGTTGDNSLLYNLMAIRPFNPIYVPGSNDTKYFNGTASTTIANMKDGGYNNTTQNLMDAVFTLKAEHLIKGLVLSANYSPRLQQDNQDVFVRTVSNYYSFDGVNKVFNQATLNATNSIRKVRSTQKTVSANALADYSYTLLGNHHFRALAGFQYQYYNYNSISASQTNLLNNDLPTLNYTNNVTVAPSVFGDNVQANAWVSYFGKLGYDYKNKYFIEGTLRNDASSRLAPGHQAQSFPGISAAWRISQEGWFANNVKFVNELKLRASYGKLGNAQLGSLASNNYPSIAVLSSGNAYPFNGVANTYFAQTALPSPGLGWETVATSNIAMDFAVLSNRLTGSVEYYKKVNDNVAIVLPQPATLGVTPSTTNAAGVEIKGWI